jgi:hypothetical protein
MIFDFHVGAGNSRYDLPPGVFRFGAAYSTAGAASAPVEAVSP